MIDPGELSKYFSSVAIKQLSLVETSPTNSNQHEFNSTKKLLEMFGADDWKNIPTRFIWFGGEQEGITADGFISWYDSRRKHPTRSEYRLYYPSNSVTGLMEKDDTLFLALRPDGTALTIVAPTQSTMHNQLMYLFGIDDQPSFNFNVHQIAEQPSNGLDFTLGYILDELGIDVLEPNSDEIDNLIEPFGKTFPTTAIFSRIARQSLPDISAHDNIDQAVMAWMAREEQMFRRLERVIVSDQLREGFVFDDEKADVDGFISFSLSIQNRRKTRAGHAFEHHLAAIFDELQIPHSRSTITENRHKPDFIFPSSDAYHNQSFDDKRLYMLAAKSTCKDRWRQVLTEAARIPNKHLVTLEPGISEHQTNQMRSENLQLVLPRSLHASYNTNQRPWLFSLSDFIEHISS